MQKYILPILMSISMAFAVFAIPVYATSIETNIDASLEDAVIEDETEADINEATEEETETVSTTGMLIEIGNTTAENTTIIVRTTDEYGTTEDVTLEIEKDTSIQEDDYTSADLSDWIAGDQITFTADKYKNSGALVAQKVRNRSFKSWHKGRNGWIKKINTEANTIDVEWAGKIYTINLENARIVAGLKNPASIDDLKIGDRVRGRVLEDADGNPLTWDAKILVVLRRGNDLFMRVTRWVVPGVITSIPEDLSLPATIEMEVLPSKFYEKGDVNNLIGAPGTKVLVDITEDTKLRRRYLGKAQLSEFSEGDKIRVIGRRDESTGNIVAKFIKNNSIQKLGVAYRLGKVTSIDENAKSFTVEVRSKNRKYEKTWTIMTDDETIFKIRDVDEAAFEDIEVDDIIRVRGTANRVDRTVKANVVAVVTHKVLRPDMMPKLLKSQDKIMAKMQKIKNRLKKLKAMQAKNMQNNFEPEEDN